MTGSYFNTETICVERCMPAERAHSRFEEARKAELDAVVAGNYNYPGIGLPTDLLVVKGEK